MNAQTTTTAENITRTRNMRLLDMVVELGLEEVTPKTFIYIDENGRLAAIEKQHRQSFIEGAEYEHGYVFDHEYAADVRKAISK
jgi:hypothetical protein